VKRQERKMNLQEATRLAARIEQEDPQCHADNLIARAAGATYEIGVTDTRTGIPFVVRDPDEWEDRKREAELFS
jgi:hypothetical protein